MDRDIRLVHVDELDRLEFLGEPFDPGSRVPGHDVVAAAPARVPEPGDCGARTSPAGLDKANSILAAVVQVVRASVSGAHASALDTQLRLQHRTAAALLETQAPPAHPDHVDVADGSLGRGAPPW